MQRSAAVRDGLVAFYERFSARDVEAFADGITGVEDAALVIGTAPDEWEAGRSSWLSAYATYIEQMPDVKLVAGDDVSAYESGDIGWAADRPKIVMPDEGEVEVRVTAVLKREDGEWRVVNAHFSIGVPDERVPEVMSWSST
jgi:ketosteroid isomerase-like protein